MYKDTVTIFNRLDDTWYPSVLFGVNVNTDKASIIAKYGENSQDNSVLNIKYTLDGEKRKIGEKEWLSPKVWRSQSEVEEDTITFAPGQDFDFFYVGDWGSEDPISDADYGIDGFYGYMNEKYDEVYAITSVSAFSLIPHFEVVGK